MEEWADITDFPGYRVSSLGRVASDKTGHILSLNYNQSGNTNAGMIKNGRLYRRAVAPMVAEAFLPPPKASHFNTPIHLDGNKANNQVSNLMWRPRWFAIKYQQQFTDTHQSWLMMPVEHIRSGEVFEHAIDLCVKYGVLIKDVVHAVHNHDNTVPFGWFEVRLPQR